MTGGDRIIIAGLAVFVAGIAGVGCAAGPGSGAGSVAAASVCGGQYADPAGSGGHCVPAASRCSVDRPRFCRRHIYPPHGRCFPVRKWSASDTRLPCVEVRRVYEDGSFTVAVLDGDGTVRYTRGVGVPNAYERSAAR
jgi:hypothetical protein